MTVSLNIHPASSMAHASRWNVLGLPKANRYAPGFATLSASSNIGVMASWNATFSLRFGAWPCELPYLRAPSWVLAYVADLA